MSASDLYLLGGCNPGGFPWVLSLEARTTEQCERAINWQRKRQDESDPPGYWAICRYDPARGFVSEAGAVHNPDRGPYTVEAWHRFRASLPPGGTMLDDQGNRSIFDDIDQ